MATGIVKFDNRDKAFGFITDKSNQELYFSLNNQYLLSLSVADEVFFTCVKDENDRLRAVKVRQIYRDQNGRGFVKNWRAGWVHFDPANWLPFIYENINLNSDRFTIQQFNFKDFVGTTDLVQAEEDEVFYAVRNGRRGHSRLVENKEAKKSKSIVLTLRPFQDELIEILSGFIGETAPPEPFSDEADESSLNFWKINALRAESFDYDQESKVKECPW